MKNKLKKIVAICLLLTLVLASVNSSALAADEWNNAQLEQASVTVPNVDVYLYPVDVFGNVVPGLTENDLGAKMQLDLEGLEIDSVGSAENVPTAYVVMVNLSIYDTPAADMRTIRGGLSKWVGEMKDSDKFILIGYTNTPSVLLDGTESRDSAMRIVNSLEPEDKKADSVAAMKEGVRMAEEADTRAYSRRVVVMYDRGRFLSETQDSVLSLVLDSYIAVDLPMYMLHNYNARGVPDTAEMFCESTGGRSFGGTSGVYEESITDDLRVWLNSAYRITAHSQSNDPTPEVRTLDIALTGAKEPLEYRDTVNVKGSVEDNRAPVVEGLYFNEDNEIVIRFSENVKNAGNVDNYCLQNQNNEEEIPIESVEYDEATFSATIILEKDLPDNEYGLSIWNVTDCSFEANPLELQDGDVYNFVKGEGSKDLKWLYVVAAVVLVVAVILVIVFVFLNKIKKQKAKSASELERIEREKRTQQREFEEGFNSYKTLPLELIITSPNGFENRASVKLKDGEECVLGRSSRMADIVIQNDPTVSKQQLVLVYKDKKLIAVDAGSTNDTYVNGEMIKGQYQLKDKDVITVGQTTIVVKY